MPSVRKSMEMVAAHHPDKTVRKTVSKYIPRREKEESKKSKRRGKQEGGTLMLPPEMEGVSEDMPIQGDIPEDTYTPEDQINAEASQLPDDRMETDFVDFVLNESLEPEEQDYLMGALEADPRLSEIFDKVVETASEFSGEVEVEGPGTGV